MVLCSCVRSTVLRTSEPLDRASDGSNLISTMNGSRSLVAKRGSELSDARSDGSKVCNAILCTSLHRTNPESYILGFVTRFTTHSLFYRKAVEDIDTSSTGLDITRLQMFGPCNGVVCLTSLAFNSPIVMCNPSMKEFRVLPQPCYKNYRYCNLGFGFDPSKNDYKVVKFAMRSTKFSNNSIDKRIEIYYLRTDSWREADAGTPIELDFLCSEFVFASWNGDFYWYTYPYHGGGAAILVFSMTNELFKEMPVPKVCLLHQRSVMRLSVLLDSLALVIYSQSERCFDIWVMDEEDGEMSWTKKFTKPYQGIERALGFRKNGEFLVESFSGLMMSYNLNTREIMEYQVDGPFPSFNLKLVPYTESLVLVKRHNELDGHIE